MMRDFALLVDAGHFWAGAASLSTGSPIRNRIEFDFELMREKLIELGRSVTEAEILLRIYWYDAAKDRFPNPKHLKISDLQNVKLRLGHLDGHGKQKGVDSLMVRDLIVIAEQRAASDILLIAGDEDLREGVADAQTRGVRIHLARIDSPHTYCAASLRREADSVTTLGKDFFDPFTAVVPVQAPSSAP